MTYEAPDSELLEFAEKVTIADLLLVEETQDLAIRFLSSIRKALLDTPVERIERSAGIAACIYRCNDLISKTRRDAAFTEGRTEKPLTPPFVR